MDPTCVFNFFFTFFEIILYKSNCIIFIFSWCGTHTKIRSKLVIIVTAGSQKITLWGPQRTPLGILRVKQPTFTRSRKYSHPVNQICGFKCSAFHIEFTENDMVLWKWLIWGLWFTVPDITPLVLHTHTISL